MKQYTVIEYEQSDFDDARENMTKERAIEILSGLPRGWFPYNFPEHGNCVCASDLENFEICCAIDVAIESLSS